MRIHGWFYVDQPATFPCHFSAWVSLDHSNIHAWF